MLHGELSLAHWSDGRDRPLDGLWADDARPDVPPDAAAPTPTLSSLEQRSHVGPIAPGRILKVDQTLDITPLTGEIVDHLLVEARDILDLDILDNAFPW